MDLKKTCNTALLAVYSLLFQSLPAPRFEILDKVVAIVDEDVVLESEVQRRWLPSTLRFNSLALSHRLKKLSSSKFRAPDLGAPAAEYGLQRRHSYH